MEEFKSKTAPNMRILEKLRSLSEKKPFNIACESEKIAKINSLTGCCLLTVFMIIIVYGMSDMDSESRMVATLIVCIIESAGVVAIVAVSYFIPMIQPKNELIFFEGGLIIRNKRDRIVRDVLLQERDYVYDIRETPMKVYGLIPYPTGIHTIRVDHKTLGEFEDGESIIRDIYHSLNRINETQIV